jgi:phosphate transport system protein
MASAFRAAARAGADALAGGRRAMAPTDGGSAAWDVERATLGRHFVRDMDHLWEQILKLSAIVETALTNAITALCDRRPDLVGEVHGEEQAINTWEVQIELDCLKVLALHNPVASDLRRVAAILKINGDLERLGDLADHIAKRARKLATEPDPVAIPPRLETLAQESLAQVHDALDALAKCDVELARGVIEADRGIDRHRRLIQAELKDAIRSDPDRINTWLRLINTARNLERIADHATNIAEAVVYLKEGRIIRHERAQAAPAARE